MSENTTTPDPQKLADEVRAGLDETSAEFGYVYCAHGSKAVADCRVSAASLVAAGSRAPIAVFTDRPESFADLRGVTAYRLPDHFTTIRFDKFYSLFHAPFRRVVYLDSDTYIFNSMDCLEGALDHYALTLTLDLFAPKTDLPAYVPWFNGGFMGVRRDTSGGRRFLMRWLERYASHFPAHRRDQSSLHRTIGDLDFPPFPLPNTFNFMVTNHSNAKPAKTNIFMMHSQFLIDLIKTYSSTCLPRLVDVANSEKRAVWFKTRYGGYFDVGGRRIPLLGPGQRVGYRLSGLKKQRASR